MGIANDPLFLQKLEEDIAFIRGKGIKDYDELQQKRESLLLRLLNEYNEGRSKSYYCIAATVMDIEDLENALREAAAGPKSLNIKEKARLMHSILDRIALQKGCLLALRK